MDIASLVEMKRNPKIPDIAPGDTVKVSARIVEGGKERIQVFQGVVIKIRRGGAGASFTVRHVASGIGVERTFPFYSPLVEKVEVVRQGKVRRAKLYYLRQLSGKAARRKIKRVDRKVRKLGEEVLEPESEEIIEPLLESEEEAAPEEEQVEEVVDEAPVEAVAEAVPVEEEEAQPEAVLEEPPGEEPAPEQEQVQQDVVAEAPALEEEQVSEEEQEAEPVPEPEPVQEEPVLEKGPEPEPEPEPEPVLEPEEDRKQEDETS